MHKSLKYSIISGQLLATYCLLAMPSYAGNITDEKLVFKWKGNLFWGYYPVHRSSATVHKMVGGSLSRRAGCPQCLCSSQLHPRISQRRLHIFYLPDIQRWAGAWKSCPAKACIGALNLEGPKPIVNITVVTPVVASGVAVKDQDSVVHTLQKQSIIQGPIPTATPSKHITWMLLKHWGL